MAIIPSYLLNQPAQGPQVWGDPGAMFALSQNLVSITEEYIAALQQQAANLQAPVINPVFPVLSAAPIPILATQPNLIDVTWTVPSEPAPFDQTLDVGNYLPGPFTVSPPTLSFPAPPAAFNQPIPSQPGVDLNFTYPVPAVTLPSPPTLLQLDTIPFSPVTIPTFNADVPTLQLSSPNIVTYTENAMYTSALLSDLQASLDDAITNGTFTGLPPGIETNLWNRARERELKNQADAPADLDRMEAMGFAFPPGVYLDAHIKVLTETNYTIAGLSRDIATEQARLILTNITKAREEATALESKFIDYANNIAQRQFEYTKYATEAGIAIYNANVEAYKASLDGYRTQALVYDTQVKGLLAQIEALKAEIDFEKVKADINTALVTQYETEVKAAEAILDVYRLEIEIIQTQANVQKIIVEVFGEQIKAYVAQVNAYTAQIEAYKAQVSTQGVIEDVYKTQVDAFAAEVNAGVAEANAQIAVFKGQIDAYTAQIEGYKAAIAGMVGQAQAASLFNTAEAEVYKAEAAALSSYNDTLTKQWEAVINEQEQVTQIGVSAAKASGDLYIAAHGLMIDANKVGAQVVAQLGAASLGAIHWANTSSWALSNNTNFNANVNTSTSTATNTNINESV
jgi:hypothetical protein